MLSFDKREVVHKGNYEFATILYQLKSRERGVIVKKWAVCSGFDPCYVISVHMKSGQVTTNFVSNHFNPVLHDCRGTMMGAISRYDAPVEDVVPVRRTREHSGVAVITSSNIFSTSNLIVLWVATGFFIIEVQTTVGKNLGVARKRTASLIPGKIFNLILKPISCVLHVAN